MNSIYDNYVAYISEPDWGAILDEMKEKCIKDCDQGEQKCNEKCKDEISKCLNSFGKSINHKIYHCTKFIGIDVQSLLEEFVLNVVRGQGIPVLGFVCKIKYVPSDSLLFEIYNPAARQRTIDCGGGNGGGKQQGGTGGGTPEGLLIGEKSEFLGGEFYLSHNVIGSIESGPGEYNAADRFNRSSKCPSKELLTESSFSKYYPENFSGAKGRIKIAVIDSGTRFPNASSAGWNALHTDPFDETPENVNDDLEHGVVIHHILCNYLHRKNLLCSYDIIPIKVTSEKGCVSLLNLMAGLLYAEFSKCDYYNISVGFEGRADLVDLLLKEIIQRAKADGQKVPKSKYFCSAGNNGQNLDERFHSPSMYGRVKGRFSDTLVTSLIECMGHITCVSRKIKEKETENENEEVLISLMQNSNYREEIEEIEKARTLIGPGKYIYLNEVYQGTSFAVPIVLVEKITTKNFHSVLWENQIPASPISRKKGLAYLLPENECRKFRCIEECINNGGTDCKNKCPRENDEVNCEE